MRPSAQAAPERTRAGLALALVGVMAVVLVVDVVRLPWRYHYLKPRVTRGSSLAASAMSGRARTLNFSIGVAARELAGGKVSELVVPKDLDVLVPAGKGDSFQGVPQATLQRRLLLPFVAGHVRAGTYDPVLSDAAIAAWSSAGRLRPMAHGVVGVVGPKRARRIALYTDAARSAVYLVPFEMRPQP